MIKNTMQFTTTLEDIKMEVDDWPVVKDARAFFKNKPKELEMFINGLYRDQLNLRRFEETMIKWERLLNQDARTEFFIALLSVITLLGCITASFVLKTNHWVISVLSVLAVLTLTLITCFTFSNNRSLKKAIEAERTNGRKFSCAVEVNKAALETLIMTAEVENECEGHKVSLH